MRCLWRERDERGEEREGREGRGQGVGLDMWPMVPYAVPLLRETPIFVFFSSPGHYMNELERDTLYGSPFMQFFFHPLF